MGNLVLYRGDAEKIREFDFHKTDKYCLVGQGIYLTNKLEVAESYRDKGSNRKNVTQLFSGEAKDRPDAYEKAFEEYCSELHRAEYRHDYHAGRKFQANKQQYEKWKEKQRPGYRELIDNKEITATYSEIYSVSRRANVRTIRVNWDRDDSVGWITEFAFPSEAFEPAIVNIDKLSRPELEVLWEHKVPLQYEVSTLEDYIRQHLYSSILDIKNQTPIVRKRGYGGWCKKKSDRWQHLRTIFEPYGYVGFEYKGGRIWGGYGNHRAFCLWDDEFVNDHKVRRFK